MLDRTTLGWTYYSISMKVLGFLRGFFKIPLSGVRGRASRPLGADGVRDLFSHQSLATFIRDLRPRPFYALSVTKFAKEVDFLRKIGYNNME